MMMLKCCTLLMVAGLSLAQTNPHNHPDTIVTEHYLITAVILPRGASAPTRVSWTLSPADGNNDRNVKLTYDAINAYVHNRPSGSLRTGPGYQGLLIDHIINDKSTHVWAIAACSSSRLEKGIIQFTSGNNLSFEQKQLIYNSCGAD